MLLIKLSLLLLAAATTSMLAAAAADKPLPLQAKPNCPDHCGNLTVPYPFGIGDHCHIQLKGLEKQYNLTCDHSTNPPSLNWSYAATSITQFSLDKGELHITNLVSKDCYDKDGSQTENFIGGITMYPPFTISGPKNKFFAVGCDTYAVFRGFRGDQRFITGCMSVCNNLSNVDGNSCSGVGCCQTNIPDGLESRDVRLSSYYNHKGIWYFNPCSYAFIVQDGLFNFSRKSFEELKDIQKFPMIVNWKIGNETCSVAQNSTVDYACKGNSTCVDQNNTAGSGYYCRCSQGYEGNPYLGCQDIDECSAEINPCGNGTCQNLPGSYSCKCNKGFKSDGLLNCIARPKGNNTPLKISLGICISFFVLLVGIFWIYHENKRRKFNKLKEKYFKVNGGPNLQLKLQQLASKKESLGTIAQIFKAEELKKATNDFNESQKIGEGGYGIVYKGILDDKKVVAIKTSKMIGQVQSDQFVNEVIVLSQISHKHVVKLLGCCLETKMPMLVYEFVGNGTLYEHIHKINGKGPLSLARRLKIATETAKALSYLHHSTSTQIVHRDVKATNILLDEKFTAKVSDFGASRLVPEDQTQLPTVVQGTMGYLDPEYLQSNTLTEKSDVYSFGVVLLELLTSKKAVSPDKPKAERNLAKVFVSTENDLDPILDDEIVKDGNREMIIKVADLAKSCLSVKGDERPTMEDVERELDKILQTLEKQPGGKPHSSSKETDHSVESTSNAYVVEVRGEGDGGSTGVITSAEYDASMQNQSQMLKPFDDGR